MQDPSASNMGRVAGKVALVILYLASEESSFITGTKLIFDNGDTA